MVGRWSPRALATLVALFAPPGLGCSERSSPQTPGGNAESTPPTAAGAPSAPIGPGSAACEPLPGRLWRLGDDQYGQAVSDLLPGVQIPALATPGRNAFEFIDTPGKLPVTGSLTPLLRTSAKNAASEALKNLGSLAPCAAAEDPQQCAGRFVDGFVSRAFRRPLLDPERARFMGVYATGTTRSYAEGIRLVIEATLQSASFLYRVELGGAPPSAAAERRTLSPSELASSLSFFFLNSVPDQQLWEKALDGSLARSEVYDAEVERLLALPRVQANLAHILVRWLKLDRILVSERATSDAPDFSALRQPMLDESRRFFSRLITAGGSLKDMFTSRTAEVDARLAEFYGVPTNGAQGVVTVELPVEQRAGILTQGSLIGSIKASNRSVHRGLFVFRELLCGEVPPPPQGINTSPPNAEVDTEREFADYRASQGTCGACHGSFDGIGLSYERHDALGRYVAVDPNGAAIDSSSTVLLDGERVPVAGVTQLAERMAVSPEVRGCVARKLMSYAVGRAASAECVSGVDSRVQAQAGSLTEFFRAIVHDPVFSQREVAP